MISQAMNVRDETRLKFLRFESRVSFYIESHFLPEHKQKEMEASEQPAGFLYTYFSVGSLFWSVLKYSKSAMSTAVFKLNMKYF